MEKMVIATEIVVLSEKPLIGRLTVHTMEGSDTFAINDDIAEHLIDMLQRFLKDGEAS